MKKKLLAVLLAAMMMSLGNIGSYAAKEEAVKENPDVGVLVEEPEEPALEEIEKAEQERAELEAWYQGLTKEQRIFFEAQISEERFEQEIKEQNSWSIKRDTLKKYLLKNLQKSQYTYLVSSSSGLDVGVPSAKYIEKIENLRKKNGSDVTVWYHLCKYSAKELEKKKTALPKDTDFKKMMSQEKYVLVLSDDMLAIYLPDGKPKGFDSWLAKSDYQDVLAVKEYQKFLPTDSAGL